MRDLPTPKFSNLNPAMGPPVLIANGPGGFSGDLLGIFQQKIAPNVAAR
jgi:hypothetical protein